MLSKKRLKRLLICLEALLGAEGGTRTPTPFRAQRPERCVSTNFTTSAQALYYCIPCDLSRGFFLASFYLPLAQKIYAILRPDEALHSQRRPGIGISTGCN